MVANVVALDLGVVEIVEVVDYGDLFDVRGEQSIDEMRADETGAASYKNPFHAWVTL